MKKGIVAAVVAFLCQGMLWATPARAWCEDLTALNGDYVFTLMGWSTHTGLLGYGAAGVMTFDGGGGISFPDANDSTRPLGDNGVPLSGSYSAWQTAHCAWRMHLHVASSPPQDFDLALDGLDSLVGTALVSGTFLVFNAAKMF